MFIRKVMLLGLFITCAANLASQAPEFTVDMAGYRTLHRAVEALSRKTGWAISYEEPLWPNKSGFDADQDAYTDQSGRRVQPPDRDRIRASIASLRGGKQARAQVLSSLVGAYRQQNTAVDFEVEEKDGISIVKAKTVKDAQGRITPAKLPLDAVVYVSAEKRWPDAHVVAIAKAVSAAMGQPISVDMAGFVFNFNGAYFGSNPNYERSKGRESPGPFVWGSQGKSARTALLDLLSASRTTTTWNLDCQAGVGGGGVCVLNFEPILLTVLDQNGCEVPKTLYCDRGCTGMPPAPPPPPTTKSCR